MDGNVGGKCKWWPMASNLIGNNANFGNDNDDHDHDHDRDDAAANDDNNNNPHETCCATFLGIRGASHGMFHDENHRPRPALTVSSLRVPMHTTGRLNGPVHHNALYVQEKNDNKYPTTGGGRGGGSGTQHAAVHLTWGQHVSFPRQTVGVLPRTH